MVTYAQVSTLTSEITSGLFVYIWSIRVADVCAILVGDFTSWIKPSSVIVESQKECGFSKSILKSPSTRIQAWGLTVWMLSIICTKLSNHSEEAEGFLYKIHTKILGALVLGFSSSQMHLTRSLARS